MTSDKIKAINYITTRYELKEKPVDPETLKDEIWQHFFGPDGDTINCSKQALSDIIDYILKEPETIAVFEFMGEKINVTRENSAFVRVVKDFIESMVNPKSKSK